MSHLSHIGGLVGGAFVSFLFLPNFRDRRWKAARRLARRRGQAHLLPQEGTPEYAASASCWRRHRWLYVLVCCVCALVTLFFAAGLPLYLWLQRFPNVSCPANY